MQPFTMNFPRAQDELVNTHTLLDSVAVGLYNKNNNTKARFRSKKGGASFTSTRPPPERILMSRQAFGVAGDT